MHSVTTATVLHAGPPLHHVAPGPPSHDHDCGTVPLTPACTMSLCSFVPTYSLPVSFPFFFLLLIPPFSVQLLCHAPRGCTCCASMLVVLSVGAGAAFVSNDAPFGSITSRATHTFDSSAHAFLAGYIAQGLLSLLWLGGLHHTNQAVSRL